MSRAGKIITGVLSFLPIIFFIGQFILFFVFFFRAFLAGTGYEFENFFIPMVIMFVLMVTSALVGIGMLIYLLIHANRNPRINEDDRLMWIILLVVLGILVFPIYWYLKIWKEESLNPIIP